MSFQAVRWALKQSLPTPGAKMLLVALADHANKAGECVVSQGTLAEETCQSVRAVQVHLSTIEALGMIRVADQYRRNKSQKSNRYLLLLNEQYADPAGCNAQNLQAAPQNNAQNLHHAESAGSSEQCAESAGCTLEQCAESAPLVPTVLEPIEYTPPVVPPTDRNGDKRPRRSRRCPAWWEPNDAHRALAAELGVDFGLEIAKLRDHEFDKPRSDWDATARNWLRKAAQMNPRRSGGSANLMLSSYDPSRAPTPHPKPVKTRMQVEHEERLRRAAGL